MLAMFTVDDWMSTFDARISPFVNLKITLDEEEIVKLGKKNEDEHPLTAAAAYLPVILLNFYSAVGGEQSIAICLSVCVCVCLC